MKIGYSKKITKNLGNYENMVIEIHVEEDLQDGQTSDELFCKLKTFVNTKIQEELNMQKPTEVKTSEIKQTFENKEANNVDKLKELCISLVKQDDGNKSKIKNLLTSFGSSKISDLNTDNIILFEKKLRAL